jgi:integrase
MNARHISLSHCLFLRRIHLPVITWFVALFKALGYAGCSSHSGRRSFITMAARNVHRSGCSLRDVQLLAGHRSIETTERYIDGDTCAQRRLIAYV